MPWIDVDQLSPDWLRHRVGCVTASHACDVMARLKRVKKAKEGETSIPSQEAAPRAAYRKKKVQEELTGMSMESYVSPYMEQGLEIEPLAVAAYEMERDLEVLPGGIYAHDTIPRFLASPDGRVGDDGLIEIKYLSGTTTEANHFDLLESKDVPIPEDYCLQMDAQLSCSGRQWVDFISYFPGVRPELRMVVRRYARDEARIAILEAEVIQFLAEFAARVKAIGDARLVKA